jgi:hypothetical protein
MIVHTPRLCQDPAFAVVQGGESEQINCQLVVSDEMYLRAKKRAIMRINGKENKQKESTSKQETDQLSNDASKKKKTNKKLLDLKEMEHGKEVDAKTPLNNGKETKKKNANGMTAKNQNIQDFPTANSLNAISKQWQKIMEQQMSLLNNALKSASSKAKGKSGKKTSSTAKRPGTVQRDDNKKQKGSDDESEESYQHGNLLDILKPIIATLDEDGRIQVQPFGESSDEGDEGDEG